LGTGAQVSLPAFIRVSVLDGFALHAGGREVLLSSCKARAIIAYLVLTAGMKEARERLTGLLWSETEDGKARGSLRQLLHCLREAFENAGADGVVADNT
jgi:DNA-binding SARP family transcriptional activator